MHCLCGDYNDGGTALLLVLLLTLYMLSHDKQARDCCLGLNCLLSPSICHVAWLMFVQLLC